MDSAGDLSRSRVCSIPARVVRGTVRDASHQPGEWLEETGSLLNPGLGDLTPGRGRLERTIPLDDVETHCGHSKGEPAAEGASPERSFPGRDPYRPGSHIADRKIACAQGQPGLPCADLGGGCRWLSAGGKWRRQLKWQEADKSKSSACPIRSPEEKQEGSYLQDG